MASNSDKAWRIVQFIESNEGTITNALRVYADHMETAAESLRAVLPSSSYAPVLDENVSNARRVANELDSLLEEEWPED